MNESSFIKNYRFLDLTRDQIKNLFEINAKEFSTKTEKVIFKKFNLSNYFVIEKNFKEKTMRSGHFLFTSYEEAEEFKVKNIAYKDFEIVHKFVLLMNR